jgi:hypothetical protein
MEKSKKSYVTKDKLFLHIGSGYTQVIPLQKSTNKRNENGKSRNSR